MSAPRLHITLVDAFACEDIPAQAKSVADLADKRMLRYCEAAPDAFLTQFTDGIIRNAHRAPLLYRNAVSHLAQVPDSVLTLSGVFSPETLLDVQTQCARSGVSFSCSYTPVASPLKKEGSDFFCRGAFAVSLRKTGVSHKETPAQFWVEKYRQLETELALKVLRVRDTNRFWDFVKVLANLTAQRINWSDVARRSGISQPLAKSWTGALAAEGLIDLVAPLTAPVPRRAAHRPKLYWRIPGFARFVSGTEDAELSGQNLRNWLENTVYLALKTEDPLVCFTHFFDTNHVCVPLIRRRNNTPDAPREAWLFPEDEAALPKGLAQAKSVKKMHLVDEVHCVWPDGEAPEAPDSVIGHKVRFPESA